MPRGRGRRGCRLNVGSTPVVPRHEGSRAAWAEARERLGLAMQWVRAGGMSFFAALAEALAWRGVARRSARELRKDMSNHMRGQVVGVPLDQDALGDWAVGATPSSELGQQLILAAEQMFHVNLVVLCLQGQGWVFARGRVPQGGKTEVWLVHSGSEGQGQYDPAFVRPRSGSVTCARWWCSNEQNWSRTLKAVTWRKRTKLTRPTFWSGQAHFSAVNVGAVH